MHSRSFLSNLTSEQPNTTLPSLPHFLHVIRSPPNLHCATNGIWLFFHHQTTDSTKSQWCLPWVGSFLTPPYDNNYRGYAYTPPHRNRHQTRHQICHLSFLRSLLYNDMSPTGQSPFLICPILIDISVFANHLMFIFDKPSSL